VPSYSTCKVRKKERKNRLIPELFSRTKRFIIFFDKRRDAKAQRIYFREGKGHEA
jgi:hypothetical protein